MLEANYKPSFFKRKWVKVSMIIIAILAIGGGVFAWKATNLLNKISDGNGGIFSSLIHSLPGVTEKLKGEKEGQVNIALLGMRGEGVEGGGLLADTIMVVSIRPTDNKASMISVPRDLYVTVPGTQTQQKINAVHAYGEQKGKGQGMQDMKKILSEVTGLDVAYAASINFEGFKNLVDNIGGINFHLDAPFSETMQFRGLKQRCDGIIYTVPSGEVETKRIQRKNGTYYANPKIYPLCFAKEVKQEELECGGDFSLPAGDVTLNGDQALCLSRSRVTSSDFERAKRQQLIIQAIKNKLLSAGTLTDFAKLNNILDDLGDNTRTDMQAWEMKRFYELYMEMNNPQIYQRVLENSEEGFLYNPPANGAGYILLPIGDNYDKIRDMAKNIFTMPAQSDIKPKM
ncbi:MAG: Cell envelope-related function transcriptional attenuator common domain containing protein [Candidatus Moranbacteria bacterium GW2011_GWA2_39_41]|nr:MAG: Cell envelope-related function transcriptional attenuator common domain containing protein [Candidatus Moranbacteria bacterium GW2011_GWA2_39_41]